MKLRSNKIIKGIAFAGCSFTWGQGLYYYSNLPSLIEQELNTYDSTLVDYSHRSHAFSLRFPRLVANHFNTWEIVHHTNGGSLDKILNYWGNIAFNINDHNSKIGKETEKSLEFHSHDPRDIGYFVLQCTPWTRTDVKIENVSGTIQRWIWFSQYHDHFKQFLNDRDLTMDEYFNQCREDDIRRYKLLLEKIESMGIKTLIMTWPHDLAKFIINDNWLNERMIKFNYLGNIYTNIEQMILDHNGLTIETDYSYFEIPPTDNHPSLLCHRIIADNIIKHIKEL